MSCYTFLILYLNLILVCGLPLNWIQKIAEGHHFDDFENYLPKFGDLPKFQYSTNNNRINSMEEIVFKKHNLTVNGTSEGKSAPHDFFESLTDTADFLKEGADEGLQIFNSAFRDNSIESNFPNISSSDIQNTPTSINITIIPLQNQTHENLTLSNNFKIEETNSTLLNETSRVTRQKVQENEDDDDNNNVNNGTKEDENKSKEGDNKDLEKEEQVDDSSEEEGNMVTGLLGSLLGSLSRPDGSIDLEAITSLLGSLSTQNPDGSYDFSGLTELLMGFFGGGDDGGGGSDIAGFLGGLVGAVLKGSAQNPPGGAKGVGLFTGRLVGNLLPSLSGPPPSEDADSPQAGGLDSGGFLGGLLQGVFAGSGGLSNSSSGISGGSSNSSGGGGGGGNNGGGSKFQIFKAVFSLITSLFTSSSGNKSASH